MFCDIYIYLHILVSFEEESVGAIHVLILTVHGYTIYKYHSGTVY